MTKRPDEVTSNIRFLKSKNVWHILSKNPIVISCGEAAANRNRLGSKGIPIFDELKSELGFFINKENKEQMVLVHCRGNQKLDRLKISGILNSEYQRITSEKKIKGLINPFGKKFRNLLQIFDTSTTKDFYPPYTMMTNAGDFEYALEFEVNSLICALRNTSGEKNIIVEDIIRVDNYNSYKRHKIGILTGNGPDSGILLWKKINDSIKKELEKRLKHSFRGDLSYPEIIVNSVPDMGISMELAERLNMTESAVIKSTINLCQNGVTLMCIACNTTQYFKEKVEEICSLYNVKFVSIPEVINNYLKENKINEFDFVGISHVVDFERLSAFKELNGKYTTSKPDTEKIKEIAYTAKKNVERARNFLINLIKNNTQYNTIIVALTEISTILSEYPNLVRNKLVVDSLQLLADYIAIIYVEGIFDTLYVDKDKDSVVFELLNEEEKEKVKNELWNILCEINYEFVPPLSIRKSTTTTFNNKYSTKVVDTKKPKDYFETLLKQKIIVSRKKSNNQVIGFMSFIPNHTIAIKNKNVFCHYISTIGVTKGERGNGITNQFYKMIEDIAKKQGANTIATRTWNANTTHLKILHSIGYKSHIIENDRGVGIHTVYLVKQIINEKN